MNLNEFFQKHELGIVEIYFSAFDGRYKAIRNSFKRMIKDSIFGSGDTPEAALADLMEKVNSSSVTRQKPAPVVQKTEPVSDDLDDLLG
jgi:hypothetical protein